MERIWFLPNLIWRNAGFGILRTIDRHLELLEPRYDPTVIPLEAPPRSDDLPERVKSPPQPTKKPFYSVADYHALYKSGELTPLDVARALLPLIRRDVPNPSPHSVAWFDTRVDLVLAAAEAATQRYRENRPRGLFDGVPVAVKGEFDVDGYATHLGSCNDYTPQPSENDPSITNWCIRQLEAAGAVLVGKLSMHEFGLDPNGHNIHYGTPVNPYHSRYYTGGSSSGCAYAVSTGLVPVALGTDGGGSVRIPAAFCSVTGLKPSHNRLSHYPGVNYASTTSVIGPLAADLRSLAAVYQLVAAPGPDTHFPAPGQLDLTPAPGATKKALGVCEAWFARADPPVQRRCRALLDRLVTQSDYTIVPIDIPFLAEGQTAHAMTILTDAAAVLTDTANIAPANRILLSIGRATPATDYLRAQKLRRLLMAHLAALWRDRPGMIIVTPTSACAGWPIASSEDMRSGFSDGDTTLRTMEYVWLANFAGVPSLSVPAGYVEGEVPTESGEPGSVPVGLMGHADWADEAALLQWGLEAEEAGADFQVRPPIWEDVIERARKDRSEQLVEV